jgi:hypothetical protein
MDSLRMDRGIANEHFGAEADDGQSGGDYLRAS